MYYLVFISPLDQSFKTISVIQKLRIKKGHFNFPIENWCLSLVFFLSKFKNLPRSPKQWE